MGVACAYYLAREGATVRVLERSSLGGGSTERSAGGIRAQFSTPVNVDLSLLSLEVWEGFEEVFGVDIAHRRTGYLFLARTEETAAAFEANVRMQNDRGVPSEYLEPAEAVAYCAGLRAEEFVAATYSPTDGFADPHLALQGFAAAAREVGAEIHPKTPVTGVCRDDGRVTGVETAAGVVEAEVVVNAAGPWASKVAGMAGVEVPVFPKRRQVLVVEPGGPVPETDPLTIDLDTGAYFRPERDGNALVGGHFGEEDPTMDPDGYGRSFDLSWAAVALERAAALARYFDESSRIRNGWAGLYAVTPDHHPIVEETVPGFVQAIGFSGHGFQHAPAVGQVVTELVCDGRVTMVDPRPLRSDRFMAGGVTPERNVA